MRNTWHVGISGRETSLRKHSVVLQHAVSYMCEEEALCEHILPNLPSQRRRERLRCNRSCRCPRGWWWRSFPDLESSSALNPPSHPPQLQQQEWTMAQESKPVQRDKNITKKTETKKHSHFDSMHSKAERWEVWRSTLVRGCTVCQAEWDKMLILICTNKILSIGKLFWAHFENSTWRLRQRSWRLRPSVLMVRHGI